MRAAIPLFLLCFSTTALANEPTALIEARYAEIQKIVTEEKEDKALRDKVTQVLESFTDFNEFGRLTLKRWWKDLKEEQRKRFVDRYRRLIHRSYVKRFKANQELSLSFRDEAQIIGDKALVKTLVKSGKSEAEVDYKLHKTEAGYRAYDIVIDEVSLMRSYRKQFGKIMKRDGFDTLIEKMTKKIEDGESSDLDEP